MFNLIHHVAIICSDYEKSKKFYTEVLGFKIINEVFRKERNSFKLDLKVGNRYQVELFSFPNSPKRLSYPEACGLRHIAFEVKAINEIIDKLKQNGVVIEATRQDSQTGKKFTFFQDPDNLPIEIYEK